MDDAVWIETTDGDLLRQLFGHYPTLHEAKLTSLSMDRAADRLVADIEYCDEADANDAPLRVRIRLEWLGVKLVDLNVSGVEILSIQFDRSGPLLTTYLTPCSGTQGRIVAERFEALLTQAHSLPIDAESLHITLI